MYIESDFWITVKFVRENHTKDTYLAPRKKIIWAFSSNVTLSLICAHGPVGDFKLQDLFPDSVEIQKLLKLLDESPAMITVLMHSIGTTEVHAVLQ